MLASAPTRQARNAALPQLSSSSTVSVSANDQRHEQRHEQRRDQRPEQRLDQRLEQRHEQKYHAPDTNRLSKSTLPVKPINTGLAQDEPGTKPSGRGFKLPGLNKARTRADSTPIPQFFDVPIPESVEDHFKDFRELFGQALCEHLSRSFGKPTSASMKLRVMGEDERTAKPCIIVLCHPLVAKKVKQFFDQAHIQAQFQARNRAFQHDLKIVVCGQAPTLKGDDTGTAVHMLERDNMSCGTLVKATTNEGVRYATLGGLIKIELDEQSTWIRGLTVAHLFTPQLHDDIQEPEETEDLQLDTFNPQNSVTVYDSNLLCIQDSICEIFDGLDLGLDLELEASPIDDGPAEGAMILADDADRWTEMGNLRECSTEAQLAANRDWAMIEIEEGHNLSKFVPKPLDDADDESLWPHFQPDTVAEHGLGKAVTVTSVYGSKKGVLASSFSYLTLGGSKDFTRAYSLRLDDARGLAPGESGAWVLDCQTAQVYGYVVADDLFLEIYVIPLHDVLQDIRQTTGALSVGLPTPSDLSMLLHEEPLLLTPPEEDVSSSQADEQYLLLSESPAAATISPAAAISAATRQNTFQTNSLSDHMSQNPEYWKEILGTGFQRTAH